MKENSNKVQLVMTIIAAISLMISIFALYLGYINQKEQLELQKKIFSFEENITKCWEQKKAANNYFDLGEYNKAVELYDRILKNCDPESYHLPILRYKGFALLNLGINNETVKIVRVSPITSAESVINHSLTYVLINDNSAECFNMALVCFKSLYNKTGDFEYVFYKGITYLYLGDLRKSIEFFNETITIINKYPYTKRGKIHNDTLSFASRGMTIAYQRMGG